MRSSRADFRAFNTTESLHLSLWLFTLFFGFSTAERFVFRFGDRIGDNTIGTPLPR